MTVGGVVLRVGGTVLRFIQFAAAIAILGIFSYFLAILDKQHLPIAIWVRAVEGLTGATALYALFGVLLTLCLGGSGFFAGIAMILDVLFIGANVAIIIETRGGNRNCGALTNVAPLRFGDAGLGNPSHSYVPTTYHQCTLLKASFALAIINAVLFFLSIFYQLAIAKHHQTEKRNNVPNTPVLAGQRRGFWRRRARADAEKGTTAYPANGNGNGYAYNNTNNAVNY